MRLLPRPPTSALLFITWLLLAGSFTAGSVVFALLIAILLPLLLAPDLGQSARRPWLLIPYAFVVLWDIVKANVAVAKIVLFMPPEKVRPTWIVVPLHLTDPEAITILAGTITLTPGTVSADISPDRRYLLVHCLHAPDPAAVLDEIQTRYEARLRKIFE